jgi:colanic acid biosynthesis protein WcaH
MPRNGDRAPERLPVETFAELVRIAPLVAIDLIVRDKSNRVLLGLRNFEPAKGWYFVPGGRILKGEPMRQAFARICRVELALDRSIENARFKGVYEHFYDVSRYGETTTHYVVLAHEIDVEATHELKADDQHTGFSWFAESEILAMPDVHEHTKAYFKK